MIKNDSVKNDSVKIEIRPMKHGDLEAVLKIETVCGLGEWSKTDFENEISNSSSLLFVAADYSKQILGFILARPITSVVEILKIGVWPHSRRRGVGDALLQKALREARQRGACESWLEVRESNQTAQNFYLRRGYKIVGKRPDYYRNPPENAVLMTFIFSDNNPKK